MGSRWPYTLLLRLALPVVLLVLWWRGWRRPAWRVDLRARLAWGLSAGGQPQAARQPLWVHGVSVGEVQAAAVLLRLLHERYPRRPLLLTTATATGHATALRLLLDLMLAEPPALQLRYAPFDLPGVAERFLRHHQPCAALFLETEVWPNLVAALASRGIPLAIVSARVSERSTRRYRRFAPHLIGDALARFNLVAAQGEADAARFTGLGADPLRVQVTGNVKLDMQPPGEVASRGPRLRARLAPARPVWVAGSTHEGEEAVCLAAQRLLGQRFAAAGRPAPLLVLVPRHPERFDGVARLLESRGVSCRRLSALHGGEDLSACEVLLVDAMGELVAFYAAADAAFVGGSLLPVGGHNLLEPAALGKPVLSGPHSFNAPDAARLLEQADALVRVSDGETMAQALWELLSQPAAAARGRRALAAVEASRGAAARTLAALAPLLGPD